MRRVYLSLLGGLAACLLCGGDADGRGFGGFRAGGFGGYREGGFGGYHYGGYSEGGFRSAGYGGYDRGFDYSGYRSGGFQANAAGGFRAGGSYDRSWSGDRGGSVNVEGAGRVARTPWGGVAAGGEREVTATGPGGRTYTGESRGGVAAGPYGRVVGGGEHAGVASGPRGTAAEGWRSAFAGGGHFATDFGLSHYSGFGAAGAAHSTHLWSQSYMTAHAGTVRTNFVYYHAFRPNWYAGHPGCWVPRGWGPFAAWGVAIWPVLGPWININAEPVYYDYGDTVVYQNNNVYVNGQDAGTAQDYAQQAINLADQGQKAAAPPDEEWKALGVFALSQGDATSSNNVFQLAVNKGGVIRGNYYDGLMDTTTPVYGSVDPKTQRAAWTIGKKNDRVFEAGIYNLTLAQTPVLVHLGTQRTQQWMLVRVQQPTDASNGVP